MCLIKDFVLAWMSKWRRAFLVYDKMALNLVEEMSLCL